MGNVKERAAKYLAERGVLIHELREMANKAGREAGDVLSAEETRRYNKINRKIEELDRDNDYGPGAIAGGKDQPGAGYSLQGSGMPGASERPGGEHLFVRTEGGREVRVVEPDESIRVAMPNLEDRGDLSLGRYVRAAVTGNWEHAKQESEAVRAQSGASDLLGGFLLPDPLSATVIDMARAQTRVIQAGGRTIPMDEGTMKVATVTGDPTAYWRFEDVEIPESDATFAQMVLTARTVGALVRTSVELIEDASNLDALLSGMLGKALGLEIDRVCLRGSGAAGEPCGILNTTGINTIPAGGGISYALFSQAVQDIAEANGEARAAIYAPRSAGELDRMQDTTEQPLQAPESFKKLRHFVTTQVPITLGAATDTEAYVGDFSALWLGIRTAARVEASRVADDTLKKLEVLIRVYARLDVAVIRPTWFTSITGITVAA